MLLGYIYVCMQHTYLGDSAVMRVKIILYISARVCCYSTPSHVDRVVSSICWVALCRVCFFSNFLQFSSFLSLSPSILYFFLFFLTPQLWLLFMSRVCVCANYARKLSTDYYIRNSNRQCGFYTFSGKMLRRKRRRKRERERMGGGWVKQRNRWSCFHFIHVRCKISCWNESNAPEWHFTKCICTHCVCVNVRVSKYIKIVILWRRLFRFFSHLFLPLATLGRCRICTRYGNGPSTMKWIKVYILYVTRIYVYIGTCRSGISCDFMWNWRHFEKGVYYVCRDIVWVCTEILLFV